MGDRDMLNLNAGIHHSLEGIAKPTAMSGVVWFLVGPLDSAESTRYQPVYTVPFVIGRRQDLSLTLACKTVSTVHAEIIESAGKLLLRDLGSTNGTYVNGRRVTGPMPLEEDDLVQFAGVAFRVRQQSAQNFAENTHTLQDNVCDRALALVQFDKMMAERAVTPYYQPIVAMNGHQTVGFEVLGRSRLFGLETPREMFRVATQLNLEVELSSMLRWEGVRSSCELAATPHLFLNTHPRELAEAGLLASMESLRSGFPEPRITLEVHESAVTNSARMVEIRASLAELGIGLAYDDFGAGQARFNELVAAPPDYVKFDMSLIHGIDVAEARRQQMLASLVQMVRDLGIVSLAEGVETPGESETCKQMGFDLAQGYLFGRPAPAKRFCVAPRGLTT